MRSLYTKYNAIYTHAHTEARVNMIAIGVLEACFLIRSTALCYECICMLSWPFGVCICVYVCVCSSRSIAVFTFVLLLPLAEQLTVQNNRLFRWICHTNILSIVLYARARARNKTQNEIYKCNSTTIQWSSHSNNNKR